MRVAQGGTKIYCPHCKDIEVCKTVPVTEAGKPAGQRWYRTDHDDIQWFRRARRCSKCMCYFFTAEVNEEFLDELVELRNALSNIKVNAEEYISQSHGASKSLEKLAESLDVLRALKLYSET